jgi:methyl-accepting chemotaxis protein
LVIIILFAVTSCIYLLQKTEKSITKPIEEIQAAMVEFSKGNLDVNINYEATDEVGILCEAVRKSSDKLKDYISNITGVIKQLEEKNMTVRVAIDYEGDFKPIQISLDNIVMSFHKMIGVFDEASGQIAIGAEKIAKTSKNVADGGSEQAREIGNLVERIDQIASKVNMNAKNAEDVKQLSQQSVSVAQMGNEQMKVLNNAMESIAKHSNKISDIIQVIHNIAKQTNLLSLNATIEAARAGNAGKGFAVVAGEIKKLAEECSSAVKFTSELIENSISAMKEGVVLTVEVSKYFDEIVHESMKTNDVIEIMSSYSKEQAEKLTDTLSYLQNISLIIESNSVAAQESSAMSSEFIAQSEKLEDLIHEYKLIS